MGHRYNSILMNFSEVLVYVDLKGYWCMPALPRKLARVSLREVTATLTCHVRLRKHLRTMGLVDSGLCRMFGITQKPHFISNVSACHSRGRGLSTLNGSIEDPKKLPEVSPLSTRDFLKR